jgi:hypothetical protein
MAAQPEHREHHWARALGGGDGSRLIQTVATGKSAYTA